MSRRPAVGVFLVAIVLVAAPALSSDLDAGGAFARLKALEGTWHGEAAGDGAEAVGEAEAAGEVIHEIVVSAAGTVVQETMGPGTPGEMINMYHLDGDDLVLTHYCAGGNQPTMRLDRQRSTPERFVFEFSGGTNLDATTDSHIHSAEIKWHDDEHIESIWRAYDDGVDVGGMTFHLAREP